MNRKDMIEFYFEDKCVARLESSVVPFVGSFISIRAKTYKIKAVNFACDYLDQVMTEHQMRCNVELVKIKP